MLSHLDQEIATPAGCTRLDTAPDSPNRDCTVTFAIAMHPVSLNVRTVDTNIPKRKSALRTEKTCKLCSKLNHFARVCRSSKKVHEVCDRHVTGADYPLHNKIDNFTDLFVDFIYFVHAVSKPDVLYDQNQAFTNVTLGPNNVPVKCNLDTGSQVYVIPKSILINNLAILIN